MYFACRCKFFIIVLMLEFGLSFFPFFLFLQLFLVPLVFRFYLFIYFLFCFFTFFLLSHPWKYFPVGLAYRLRKK